MTDPGTELERIAPAAPDPMHMIQVAFDKAIQSGGPEALAVANMIIEQMTKQRDYEDRERFNAALRRIQDRLKPIVKRGWNNETKSWYALSDDVDNEIDQLIREEGMTLSFRPDVSPHPESVLIVGVLSLGAYSREYPLDVPADGKGAKGGGVMTRTHATVSATTYGMRAIKKLIFNLRFKGKDDDGNKASVATGGKQPGRVDERRQIELIENIRQAPNMAELQRLYLMALGEAENVGDGQAVAAIIKEKTIRLNTLQQQKGTAK